ncbi:hypothetical protein OG232_03690 [Streptomyces sp. NBC_01411]|uniref:hypothetical protein n=1 Tax=Streptomyces sp. NBC_01411 TaxID=2903857 RepID=UPI0032465755
MARRETIITPRFGVPCGGRGKVTEQPVLSICSAKTSHRAPRRFREDEHRLRQRVRDLIDDIRH